MTTRKLAARIVLLVALAAAALGGGGCATPGPLHVYTVASPHAATVSDTGGDTAASEVPSFLEPGEMLTGFAYDPFTDHFFLRLAPGNRIRVVDRPARAVKREFTVAGAATNGGDLAVRPRDGHVFLTLIDEPALLEVSRFGEFIRKIALPLPAVAVAYDAEQNRLLVLNADGGSITTFDRNDRAVTTVHLSRKITAGALGYDAERHELYAPLDGEPAIGVFGETGQILRTLPIAAEFLDVGPRSFLRMF